MDWSKETGIKIQLAIGLWLAMTLISMSVATDGSVASFSRLTQFEVTRSNTANFNANESRVSLTLPDSWHDHQQHPFTHAWYQTTLVTSGLPHPFAVYIPRVSMNASVLIDGVEIGNGGGFTEPISRNHGRPLIFFAPSRITEGVDQVNLVIHVADNDWALGYLGPVYVGDPATLVSMYRTREFWQVQFTVALALLMFMFAVTAFALFARRRQETYFFWFGAAMLLFAIDTLNVFVTDIPIDRKTWEVYTQGVVFAFAIATAIFIHRFTQVGWPRFEPILWLLLVIKLTILLKIDPTWFYFTASIFNLLVIGYGLLLNFMVTRAYLKTRKFEAGTTAIAGTILLLFGFHTLLIQAGILSPENLHLIQFGAPCFFFLISLTLINRFLHALDDTAALASQLDIRVREKERELATIYEELSILDQNRALTDERARIMREVHDGFGGQLVGALAMLEANTINRVELSNYIKTSLLDLRVMIDSLDPNTREVAVALGMLRTRVEPILKTRNLSLAWDLTNLPADLELNPKRTLNLLRVLQELISNIVKHSTGDQIKLTASVQDSDHGKILMILLWENGTGFEPNFQTGKGLRNVRRRILDLDGEIRYANDQNGFATIIVIPGLLPAQ